MTRLKLYLAAIGAGIMAMIYALARARRNGANAEKLNAAKGELKAHERLNNAKSGSEDDDLNIGSLRDFADKYGKQ